MSIYFGMIGTKLRWVLKPKKGRAVVEIRKLSQVSILPSSIDVILRNFTRKTSWLTLKWPFPFLVKSEPCISSKSRLDLDIRGMSRLDGWQGKILQDTDHKRSCEACKHLCNFLLAFASTFDFLTGRSFLRNVAGCWCIWSNSWNDVGMFKILWYCDLQSFLACTQTILVRFFPGGWFTSYLRFLLLDTVRYGGFTDKLWGLWPYMSTQCLLEGVMHMSCPKRFKHENCS